MQQQQRRPVAADARENPAATGVDPLRSESREKIGEFCHGCSLSLASELVVLYSVYVLPEDTGMQTKANALPPETTGWPTAVTGAGLP
jgi:hypothetical protein